MGDRVDLLDPYELEDLLVELNGIRITSGIKRVAIVPGHVFLETLHSARLPSS